MKMSEVFKLPIHDNMISILPFVKEPYTEIGVIAPTILAINNHDALVEALTEVIKHTNHYGTCEHCQISIGIDEEDRAGWPDGESPYHEHAEDCSILKAINLLDKIKGESK